MSPDALDLVVPAGPGVSKGLVVPAAELSEQFSRSSGPGGQGVNTTDSRVQLALDLATCSVLDDTQRDRALSNLAGRLDGTTVRVEAQEHRQQRRNRAAARQRLSELLREALAPPPPARRATRPTKGSVRRRLDAKKRRGEIKHGRGRIR